MMSMAFSKPIIAVLKGDGKEALESSGGAVFAEEDPLSVKEAIMSIAKLSNKEKIHLGQMNRLYYEENFSLPVISKKIEENLK